MQRIVTGVGHGIVLAVIGVSWIGSAAVVGSRGDTGWDVLIHRVHQVQTAKILVADGEGTGGGEPLFHLKAPLHGVAVLEIQIHSGEVDQAGGRSGREDIRKDGRAGLRGGKSDV